MEEMPARRHSTQSGGVKLLLPSNLLSGRSLYKSLVVASVVRITAGVFVEQS